MNRRDWDILKLAQLRKTGHTAFIRKLEPDERVGMLSAMLCFQDFDGENHWIPLKYPVNLSVSVGEGEGDWRVRYFADNPSKDQHSLQARLDEGPIELFDLSRACWHEYAYGLEILSHLYRSIAKILSNLSEFRAEEARLRFLENFDSYDSDELWDLQTVLADHLDEIQEAQAA